ncbi:hypothetical protein D3C80_2086400 [compost metagenome]
MGKYFFTKFRFLFPKVINIPRLSKSIFPVGRILSFEMLSHTFSAISISPWRYITAFSAPIDVPDTPFTYLSIPNSFNAFHAPI